MLLTGRFLLSLQIFSSVFQFILFFEVNCIFVLSAIGNHIHDASLASVSDIVSSL